MNSLQPSAGGKPPTQSRSFSDVLKGQSESFNPKPPSSFRGKPSVSFSEEDIQKYAEPFQFTLIGKFSIGRPPMETIRKSFHTIGFSGHFTLGLIDSRHILIRFDRQEDYLRCWKRGFWTLEGFLMRVIKWHPNFSIDTESPLVPVWINLPLLPIHLYNKEALFSITRLIGDPLKIDAATESLTRPSQARVCIELDLTKDRCDEIYISLGSFSYWQKIEYENVPHYCSVCFKIGHQKDSCRKDEKKKATASTNAGITTNTRETGRKEFRQISKPIAETKKPETPQEDSVPKPMAATFSVIQTGSPQIQQDTAPKTTSAEAQIEAESTLPTINPETTQIADGMLPMTAPILQEPSSDLPLTCTIPDPITVPAIPQEASLHPNTPLLPDANSEDSASSKLTKPTEPIQAEDTAENGTMIAQIPFILQSQEELAEDIFELGEIQKGDRRYLSDTEPTKNQDKPQTLQPSLPKSDKPATLTSTEPPESSNAAEFRGKNRKKQAHQVSERVSTRSARSNSNPF